MTSPSAQPYFATLICFKLAVTAILLLIGWDAFTFNGNPGLNVALVTALAFTPAAIARPLYKLFQTFDQGKFLVLSLVCAAIGVAIELMVINSSIALFLLVHFLVWTFIFLIEIQCEKWFFSLAKSLPQTGSRSLSGTSTALIQISCIVGPFTAAVLKGYSESAPYIGISMLFILGAIFARKFGSTRPEFSSPSPQPTSGQVISRQSHFTLSFALIWPTLAVFNMAVPILSRTGLLSSLNVAALIEAVLAGSTALAGILYPRYARSCSSKLRSRLSIAFLLIATLLPIIFSNTLPSTLLAVFLLGLGYGYFRIESRVQLGLHFNPSTSSMIVANANALSAPLVLLSLGAYWIGTTLSSSTHIWMMSLTFLISGAVFWNLLSNIEGPRNSSALGEANVAS